MNLLVNDLNKNVIRHEVNEAKQVIVFLNELLQVTFLADFRSVFSDLFEERAKPIMLSIVSDEYPFRIFDLAVSSEKSEYPMRVEILAAAALLSFALCIVLVFFMQLENEQYDLFLPPLLVLRKGATYCDSCPLLSNKSLL